LNDISKKILSLIEQNKFSYGELSSITKIPKSALQRYATGQTEKIPLDRLKLIAEALHTTPAYLMGWEDPPADQEPQAQAAPEQPGESTHEKEMLQLAKRMEPMPEEDRQAMKGIFNDFLKLYLKATGLPEAEDQ
jgi:transcriptional regulator with XRE-family HTH domain